MWCNLILRSEWLLKSLGTVDANRADEYKSPHARSSSLTCQIHGALNIDPTKFIQRVCRLISDQMHTCRTVHNNRNILDGT